MNIKRNIIFALERRKKDGVLITENVPIRMRVIYNSKRIEIATGYRIDASKWDSNLQQVKRGCTNKLKQSATEINADLQRYGSEMQKIFKEFEIKELIPIPEQIKDIFNSRLRNEEQPEGICFMQAFDEFVSERGVQNSWTHSTYEKFAAVKNHLLEFNPSVSFKLFDEVGLNKYVLFLRDKRKMRNSTIENQLSFLKWFLRWSFGKGYTTLTAYETFKPKLKSTQKKVIFLTWDELTRLRECEIPESKQYLGRVRDVFLFCCFTGLRYSDVFNLRKSDIKEDHIEITTVKTADKDKALPVISNQRMNDYLKELAEMAGIDEVTPKYALLSTHAGRRTFICNALSLGIPANVVMKWTGHSDYKAMKPYIDIADDIKANAMNKFNQL